MPTNYSCWTNHRCDTLSLEKWRVCGAYDEQSYRFPHRLMGGLFHAWLFQEAPIAVWVPQAGRKRPLDAAHQAVGDRQPVMQFVPVIGVVGRDLGPYAEVDHWGGAMTVRQRRDAGLALAFLCRRLGAWNRLRGDMGRHEGQHDTAGKPAQDLIQPGMRGELPGGALDRAWRVRWLLRLDRLRPGVAPELVADLDRVVGAVRRGEDLVACLQPPRLQSASATARRRPLSSTVVLFSV